MWRVSLTTSERISYDDIFKISDAFNGQAHFHGFGGEIGPYMSTRSCEWNTKNEKEAYRFMMYLANNLRTQFNLNIVDRIYELGNHGMQLESYGDR